MIEQKNIGIEEMPNVPGATLQAIAQEELPDQCRIGPTMEAGALGHAGHAVKQFGRPTEGMHASPSGSDEGAVNVKQYQSGHEDLRNEFQIQRKARASAPATRFDFRPKRIKIGIGQGHRFDRGRVLGELQCFAEPLGREINPL